jgi:hypothetical protein
MGDDVSGLAFYSWTKVVHINLEYKYIMCDSTDLAVRTSELLRRLQRIFLRTMKLSLKRLCPKSSVICRKQSAIAGPGILTRRT